MWALGLRGANSETDPVVGFYFWRCNEVNRSYLNIKWPRMSGSSPGPRHQVWRDTCLRV